jgi:hypothetical protein
VQAAVCVVDFIAVPRSRQQRVLPFVSDALSRQELVEGIDGWKRCCIQHGGGATARGGRGERSSPHVETVRHGGLEQVRTFAGAETCACAGQSAVGRQVCADGAGDGYKLHSFSREQTRALK